MSISLTPDQADLQRLQKASEDLQDVTELAKSTGWNRWFMGRVNKKIAELEKEVLEPAADATEVAVGRNRARRDVLMELKTWLGADERTARAEVERKQ